MNEADGKKRVKDSPSKASKSKTNSPCKRNSAVSMKGFATSRGASTGKASRSTERGLRLPHRGPSRFTVRQAIQAIREVEAARRRCEEE
jgi:hypothetical protein